MMLIYIVHIWHKGSLIWWLVLTFLHPRYNKIKQEPSPSSTAFSIHHIHCRLNSTRETAHINVTNECAEIEFKFKFYLICCVRLSKLMYLYTKQSDWGCDGWRYDVILLAYQFASNDIPPFTCKRNHVQPELAWCWLPLMEIMKLCAVLNIC